MPGPPNDGNVPTPARERAPWVLAGALVAVCAAVLVAVISGRVGSAHPPPVPLRAATPGPTPSVPDPVTGGRRYVAFTRPARRPKIVAKAPSAEHPELSRTGGGQTGPGAAGSDSNSTAASDGAADPATVGESADSTTGGGPAGAMSAGQPTEDSLQDPIAASWMSEFYRIYEQAQKTFGVNWLLTASIHRQESAFSTAPSTYHGLNFAGCCGGPMQFNVTNGPVTTWDLVAGSYRYGHRPATYDHRTAVHPSIYDDFDSIMAATHLLALDGAGFQLNDSAWWAAYDYYGHDEYGVTYADEVLARAIGWSQHGFCANCELSSSLVNAVYAAYGVPVLSALQAEQAKAQRAKRARTREAGRTNRSHAEQAKARGAE